jgi:hypothetical protein
VCPVSHGSLTPKVRRFGSFSIHFTTRRTPYFEIRTPACLSPVGGYFCQTYFYSVVLIQPLCGLRPAEISQLRCADIAALHGEWHFRFAKRSVAEGDDDEDNEGEADTVLEDEGLQPWLFPEWKVYILPLDTSDGPKLSRKLGST